MATGGVFGIGSRRLPVNPCSISLSVTRLGSRSIIATWRTTRPLTMATGGVFGIGSRRLLGQPVL